jgi:ketopantoate reductase
MNERLKELEKQSVIYQEDEEYWDFDCQKFAELIVGECMQVASPNYMSTPEDSVYYVEQAINRIAKHFGVEE